MLIVPMIGVLIMHDVLQNYVTMKVIVITMYGEWPHKSKITSS